MVSLIRINTALTARSDTAKYRKSGSPGTGFDNSKGEERYFFRSSKVDIQHSFHLKVVPFLGVGRKVGIDRPILI